MHPPAIVDGVLGDLAGYMRATPAAKRVARSTCAVHCIFALPQRKNNWVIQDIIVSRIPNNSGAHTIFRGRSHALMMRDMLTFMPRLVRNMPHDLQSKIQTLCGIGGGGAPKVCTGCMRG